MGWVETAPHGRDVAIETAPPREGVSCCHGWVGNTIHMDMVSTWSPAHPATKSNTDVPSMHSNALLIFFSIIYIGTYNIIYTGTSLRISSP